MYCPKCATPNADDARFCRACGTAVEVVALALEGKLVTKEEATKSITQQSTAERLELNRAKGMRSLVTGSLLMAVSLAILFVPMLFSTTHAFPWVVIWSAFFGWMAVWGTISVVLGIGRVMESNRIQEQRTSKLERAVTTSELPGSGDDRNSLGERTDLPSPPSVTETTTRNLDAL